MVYIAYNIWFWNFVSIVANASSCISTEYLVSVTAGLRGHMQPSCIVEFMDSKLFVSINIFPI